MKRLYTAILVFFFALVCSVTPVSAATSIADSTQESVLTEMSAVLPAYKAFDGGVIDRFESEIILNKDGSALITEKFLIYFPIPKHGFIRFIPTKLLVDGKKTLRTPIDLTKVTYQELPTNTAGRKPVERSTYVTDTSTGGYLAIQIGDGNETITGAYVYTIAYKIQNIIRYQDTYDEFYFNILGDKLELPVLRAKSSISPLFNTTQQVCYTGAYGTTASNCTIDKTNGELVATTTQISQIFEAFTIGVQYPKNEFDGPSLLSQLIEALLIFTPVAAIIFALFYGFNTWQKYGKDKNVGSIPPIFLPTEQMKQLSLSLMQKILSMNKTKVNIAAELIKLAELNLIEITVINKKVTLSIKPERKEALSNYLDKQSAYLKTLIATLTENFSESTDLSTLSNKATQFIAIEINAYSEFTKSTFIDQLSVKKSMNVVTVGSLLLVVAFIAIIVNEAIFLEYWGLWVGGFGLAGIIVFLFNGGMLKRSNEGIQLQRDLLGLKKYIKAAEIERLEFFNNPKEMISHFETILPFAAILGLDKQWTKLFGNYLEQIKYEPTWYHGNTPFYVGIPHVYANLDSALSKTVATLATPPSSGSSSFGGGGGFSGGGGGGGGGSSW